MKSSPSKLATNESQSAPSSRSNGAQSSNRKSANGTGKKDKAPVTTSKALLASEYAEPSSSSSSPSMLATAAAQPRTKPAILPIAPNSSLLSRLDAFLPQLEQANTSLFAAMAQEPGESGKRKYDIESVTPGQDKVIEMKLGLGLFEARDRGNSSSDAQTPSQRLLSLPFNSAGPCPPPAISFVTSHGADGPRIYSADAASMDIDDTSSSSSSDGDGSEEGDADSGMDDREAITAASLEQMVMQFYSEPLGGGDEGGSDQYDGGADDDDNEDHEGHAEGARPKVLVEEMMDGIEPTSSASPSPRR